nr:bifunctional metallophosphatase/5'-nucleotidase [Bacteroidaceae bacterium]
WMTSGVSDEEFIPATSNIDIVLGGHSHTYFASPQVLQNKDGVPVPDNKMGKNARYVASLRLTMQRR